MTQSKRKVNIEKRIKRLEELHKHLIKKESRNSIGAFIFGLIIWIPFALGGAILGFYYGLLMVFDNLILQRGEEECFKRELLCMRWGLIAGSNPIYKLKWLRR